MDSELWDGIKKGDKDAFMQLYQAHYQHLYTFGCRVYANRELVKDCIHEMFCEIWNGRDKVQRVSNSRSYLYTYLKRKVLKEVEKVRLTGQSLAGDHLEHPSHELSYEQLLIGTQADAEMQAKLQLVLQKLTKAQREVIRLKFYNNLSYEEVASTLEVQPRTAYNLVYEALKLLRKHMKVVIFVAASSQLILLKKFL